MYFYNNSLCVCVREVREVLWACIEASSLCFGLQQVPAMRMEHPILSGNKHGEKVSDTSSSSSSFSFKRKPSCCVYVFMVLTLAHGPCISARNTLLILFSLLAQGGEARRRES